jgi:hypothetical protein
VHIPMKHQILFSPDTEKGSSEPVKRLAEKYNIPEKDVEALLYGSRAPKVSTEGSSNKDKPMPEDFRPNYAPPPTRQSGWSPLTILSLVVGILGILALTIVLVAVIGHNNRQNHDFVMHNRMMGIPPPIIPGQQQQPPMVDTTSKNEKPIINQPNEEVPPPSLRNEFERNRSTPKRSHSTVKHSSSGFITSNSLEAQERLAELRADGNSKARIRQMKKNGVTLYNVK